MKKVLLGFIFLIASTTAFAQTDDDQGFYFGGGAAATVNDDCGSWCDTTGYAVETGYNFNKIVAIEAKYGDTEFEEDSAIGVKLNYVGVNVGHTFNSSWVRLYGKVGHLNVKETDDDYNESESDSAFAYGIGVSFTPFAHQKGLYIKIESMTADVFEDTIGYGQVGVGFQF